MRIGYSTEKPPELEDILGQLFPVLCLSVRRRTRNHGAHRRPSKGRNRFFIFFAMRVLCCSDEDEIELERCAREVTG